MKFILSRLLILFYVLLGIVLVVSTSLNDSTTKICELSYNSPLQNGFNQNTDLKNNNLFYQPISEEIFKEEEELDEIFSLHLIFENSTHNKTKRYQTQLPFFLNNYLPIIKWLFIKFCSLKIPLIN